MAQTGDGQIGFSNDISIQGNMSGADDVTRWATQAEHLCQNGVQREIQSDLAHGFVITYGSIGSAAGKIFQRWPDGRRFEIRILENGEHELIRQVAS